MLKSNRHSIYSLNYNLVVCTLNKKECLNSFMYDVIKTSAITTLTPKKGCFISLDVFPTYVQLSFDIPPQASPAAVVNTFKTVSSKQLRNSFGSVLEGFYTNAVLWERNYLLVSIGFISEKVIQNYITNI